MAFQIGNILEEKGTYLLIIKSNKNSKIKVGKLGFKNFKKGFYIYIGSAKHGFRKRILRYFKNNIKKRWHIDYLINNKYFKLVSIILINDFIECKIANYLINKKINFINKFGSSDCNCLSHLFYFNNTKEIIKIIKNLSNNFF